MRRYVVLNSKRTAKNQRLVDLYDRVRMVHLHLSGPTDIMGDFSGPVTLNVVGVTEPVSLVSDDPDTDPQDITGVRLRNDLIRGLLASVIRDGQD